MQDTRWRESYHSTKMQSVYSAPPAEIDKKEKDFIMNYIKKKLAIFTDYQKFDSDL